MLKTKEGFEFRFHHRVPLAMELGEDAVALREGTACEVMLPDSVSVEGGSLNSVTGFSVVHPSDGYSRAEGRRHSLASAVRELPREVRKEVWRAYWAMRGAVGNA